MTKTSIVVTASFSIYIHSIWVSPRYRPCLLIWVYYSYICPFYSFYWSRFCLCSLLENLLFPWPNLGLWHLLPLYPYNILPWYLNSLLNYCSILLDLHSDSMNLHQMTLFISLLNFSINGLLLCPLSLATLLNSCTNSSIISLLYSIFFNSAIFIVSSSLPPNSFFRSAQKSSY